MLLQFKYLQPAATAGFHAPAAHREMIAAIYSNLESPAGPTGGKPVLPEAGGTAGETIHSVRLVQPTSTARIRIDSFGEDPVSVIRSRLKALCLQKWEVVHLLLSLSDPGTSRWCERFEAMGFFFAGILPWGLPSGDALILQYLNNVPLAYGSIRTATPFAARLLDYIRTRDPNRE
jgi:serine/threonine-protein kinase RsbW